MGGLQGSAGWVVLGRGWRLKSGRRRGTGRGASVLHLSGFGDCSPANPHAREQRQVRVEDLPSLEPNLVFACWAADEFGACFVDQPGCTVPKEQQLAGSVRDVLGGVPVSSFFLCRERLGWWAAWPWGHRKHFSVLDCYGTPPPLRGGSSTGRLPRFRDAWGGVAPPVATFLSPFGDGSGSCVNGGS